MLYDDLKNYVNKNMVSFHTPGHKGVNMFKEPVCMLDLTELPDTDSLYEANGILLDSENRASRLFESNRTLISSGGNTLCIQTMLRLASFGGKHIIAGRNIHRSAVSAMALLGLQPDWLVPGRDAGAGLPGRIKTEDVSKKLDEVKKPSAVYITSPDYYGVISDIESIAKECKKRDSYLLVDNAHGTHLKFLETSIHPLDLGATMSADSAHKTLPVLTGGAWLHIKDKNLAGRAKEAMALFGSTSPSYPIMCSLDMCIKYILEKGKSDFLELSKKAQKIKNIAQQKGLKTPKGLCDPTRITLSAKSIGYTGKDFAKYLRLKKIEPEFNCENYVVLIASPFNSIEDLKRLESAILEMKEYESIDFCEKSTNYFLPKVNLTLREAIFAEHELVPLKNCVNRTAGEVVCPCPPGVPVVMPGEVIGEFEKEELERYGISKIYVVK